MKIRTKKNQISHFYGLLSELFIIILLYRKNYFVIKWRYRNSLGEIDIVSKNKAKKEIIFVEVKYRTDTVSYSETINHKKQKRICESAELFLSENYPRYKDYFVRFDACFVNHNFAIRYISNAWQVN
jgi:Holliday junction resolvase-like predicted endonuclease